MSGTVTAEEERIAFGAWRRLPVRAIGQIIRVRRPHDFSVAYRREIWPTAEITITPELIDRMEHGNNDTSTARA